MKKKLVFGLLLGLFGLLSLTSCKSEFEKIRASGDPDFLFAKSMEYYNTGEYQKAQTLYELIIGAFRGKKELEEIYFNYAYTYYHLNRYVLAAYYFNNFSQTFPNSYRREEADFMVGYANYQMSPVYRLDQTYTDKAIEEFQNFVNTYPESERVTEANELIDKMRKKMEIKAFESGELYYNLRQYQAALTTYENVIRDYPETTNVEEIRYKMAKAAYLLAQNSIYEKRLERYKEAIKFADDYLAKYRKTEKGAEIVNIQQTINRKIKELNQDGRRYQEQSARVKS